MKNNLLQTESNRAEQWIYASLGLAGVLSIVLALASFSNFVRGKDQAMAQWSGSAPRSQMTAWRYVKSGQWRADVRTLSAMAQYLMEPEPDQQIARVQMGVSVNSPNVGANLPTSHTGGVPNV
jgi:hypothetical protein